MLMESSSGLVDFPAARVLGPVSQYFARGGTDNPKDGAGWNAHIQNTAWRAIWDNRFPHQSNIGGKSSIDMPEIFRRWRNRYVQKTRTLSDGAQGISHVAFDIYPLATGPSSPVFDFAPDRISGDIPNMRQAGKSIPPQDATFR